MKTISILFLFLLIGSTKLVAIEINNKSQKELKLEQKLENLVKKYSLASTKRSKAFYYQKIKRLLAKISSRNMNIEKPRL
tara:strand:- start:1895 stop:2134 length:240 start_codon:yes stop_codon:yes gene_type:complete